MKNVSKNLENFIDFIDDSIINNYSISYKNNNFVYRLKKRPLSSKLIKKSNKFFTNKSVEIKNKNNKEFSYSKNNYNSSLYEKRKFKLKNSNNIKKNINENILNKRNTLRSEKNTLNYSIISGDQYKKRIKKININKLDNESLTRNKKENINNSKNNNYYSMLTSLYNPKNEINTKKRPQSAINILGGIKKDNYYKKSKNKYCSTCNSSKNYSRSLYGTQTNIYFDKKKYKILKPKYLTKFIQNSKKLKNSYKNDLKNVYLKKTSQSLIDIAKEEIEMKDPNYHNKQMFKNLIKIKKTLKYAFKMRDDEKFKMEYFGPGNIENTAYIRKRSANLLRFYDSIYHMNDEQFFKYKKLILEFYPNLTKKVIKVKYKIPKRIEINEEKIKNNEKKINKLISLLKKH